jgi:hypothetical protein
MRNSLAPLRSGESAARHRFIVRVSLLKDVFTGGAPLTAVRSVRRASTLINWCVQFAEGGGKEERKVGGRSNGG